MTKLEDIHSEWARDAAIDDTELDRVAGETPRLHSKYLRMMSDERMVLKKLEADLAELVQAKTDRLSGNMSAEDLAARGWHPEPRRLSQVQIGPILEADHEVVNLKLRISLQREKVDCLDSIMKMILGRNYVVTNMVNWKKFINGAG